MRVQASRGSLNSGAQWDRSDALIRVVAFRCCFNVVRLQCVVDCITWFLGTAEFRRILGKWMLRFQSLPAILFMVQQKIVVASARRASSRVAAWWEQHLQSPVDGPLA